MKIALLGYGKMGKTIEGLAQEAGHQIVLRIEASNKKELVAENIRTADVAIEFTRPETAFEHIQFCLEQKVPVVSGTTGWLDQMETIKQLCHEKKGAFFYASNFSVGVNLFFALNRYLAGLMNDRPQYQLELEEIHHTQKLDAPSGTAITLAEGILDQLDRKTALAKGRPAADNEIQITSKRIDPTPGTHSILYSSAIDSIRITHEAHSREGFARGALMAAEWLIGKQGVFGMQDLLGI